uniref:AAA+ ATPase domain-containing protein n=1 Tax=Leersia perrieri TaxID=77586 RepID=A0A0D9WX38_9ORYZ
MEIVTGAMNSLASLLVDEYQLQEEAKHHIVFLVDELDSMQAALVMISEVPFSQLNEQVKAWARDVRELSYDIEDSVDAFMVQAQATRESNQQPDPDGGLIKGFMDRIRSFWNVAMSRCQIAANIRRIKKDVEDVSERRKRYKLANGVAKSTVTPIDPRLPAMYEDFGKLVGIHEPRDELVKLLMGEEDGGLELELKVVNIVGVGGLGKTTLANAVYQLLGGEFQCRAFISVSLKPDIKRIFRSILLQISGKDCANTEAWDEREYIDKIRHFLNDKRYFIIIDDLWDYSAWTIIRCSFTENNLGSRIIVTTRKFDVSSSCSSQVDGNIYMMKPLSYGDSKRLFNRRVFNSQDNCPDELKEISEKLLVKCGGLPLAIITIASLLVSKPRKTLDQWCSVHNSIGRGLQDFPSVEDMRQILSLSYYDLPPHLKTCLLYLSIFPEDCKIERDHLIWKWIGEGFIHEKQGISLYEQGESYFNELINRSMIEPEDIDACGRAEACHVHDMVLDLIIFLSTAEKFATLLDCHQPIILPRNTRRLSVVNNDDLVLSEATMNLSHLRSLNIFSTHDWMLSVSISRFKVLRVFDIEYCYGQDLNSQYVMNLASLLHLRYLGLRNRYIYELPKDIGNLQFLQILDLRNNDIYELPPSIVQLKNLVRLCVDDSTIVPHGIGNMKSLQELFNLGVNNYTSQYFLDEIGCLTGLRVLHIRFPIFGLQYRNEAYDRPFLQCLHNLEKLQTLSIGGAFEDFLDFMSDSWWVPQQLQSFSAFNPFSGVPSWISLLTRLSYLTITVDIMRPEDLEILANLPVLCFLSLDLNELIHGMGNSFSATYCRNSLPSKQLLVYRTMPVERLTIGPDGFHSLTELKHNTMELVFAPGAMQRLEELTLRFRVRETKDRHGNFDFGMENLSQLRYVKVELGCNAARASVVEEAEIAIWDAADNNPNCPIVEASRHREDSIVQEEEDATQQDDAWFPFIFSPGF